jgi:Na+-translocating ferredoxin:NAD+ oxidoreductase RnfG subunit
MTHHRLLDKMSKEELVLAVKTYGCGMLKALPVEVMTKEQIVEHLKTCQCPVIKKLLHGSI